MSAVTQTSKPFESEFATLLQLLDGEAINRNAVIALIAQIKTKLQSVAYDLQNLHRGQKEFFEYCEVRLSSIEERLKKVSMLEPPDQAEVMQMINEIGKSTGATTVEDEDKRADLITSFTTGTWFDESQVELRSLNCNVMKLKANAMMARNIAAANDIQLRVHGIQVEIVGLGAPTDVVPNPPQWLVRLRDLLLGLLKLGVVPVDPISKTIAEVAILLSAWLDGQAQVRAKPASKWVLDMARALDGIGESTRLATTGSAAALWRNGAELEEQIDDLDRRVHALLPGTSCQI